MTEPNWNLDRFSCSKCRVQLVVSNADISGSGDGVEIALRHLPCLACPQGHEKSATSPDFGEALLEAMFGEGGIPVVKRRGILRKTALCPRCDADLGTETQATSFTLVFRLRQPGRRRDVEIDRAEAEQAGDPSFFVVETSCPAFICAKCGTRATASGAGLTSPIRNAVVEALETNLSGGR